MGRAKKVYAVSVGRQTGVFEGWDEVHAATRRFPRAAYRSFRSRADAEAWLAAVGAERAEAELDVWTDGSWDPGSGRMAFGACYRHDGQWMVLAGGVEPSGLRPSSSLAELHGVLAAVQHAPPVCLRVHVDNDAARNWASGTWGARDPAMRPLVEEVQRALRRRRSFLVPVRAHAGDEGNERADRLAAQGYGRTAAGFVPAGQFTPGPPPGPGPGPARPPAPAPAPAPAPSPSPSPPPPCRQ